MLILVPLLPLVAALLSLVPAGRRFAPLVTLAAAVVSLALAVVTAAGVLATHEVIAISGWVAADGLSALLLLLVTFANTTSALFSWGYIDVHERDVARVRSYYAHFNLFAFALALVPVLAQPALVWIGIEFTAVFSVLLVAFDGTRTALEAAWKYIALMFLGAAIALLGFFVLFYAQVKAGGGVYSWDGLRAMADRLPPDLATGAFLLVLVGFGMKVGFVPLHTWLPDAHSQAPSPVCALLSGVKTTCGLYVILRLAELVPPDRTAGLMRGVGLLSVGVAAFLLLQVHDYKRLFAFSTVEHMGIIFVAAGLGVSGGPQGAMLQMVSHTCTKTFCFLVTGAVLLSVGTREIAAVRGLLRSAPLAGGALLFGALAIGGAPPFAVFPSEFTILREGILERHGVTVGLLAAFIVVAFVGIMLHVNRMCFGSPPDDHAAGAGHHALPPTCVAALVIAAVPVLMLGLWQPDAVHRLVELASAALVPAVSR